MVDHVHETVRDRTTTNPDDRITHSGPVRGIICWACNRGIGALGDNVEGLRKALTYAENGVARTAEILTGLRKHDAETKTAP